MRVAIEIFGSRFFYIDMGDDDCTIADVKRKIGEQEDLPFDRLILLIRHSNGTITIMRDEDYLHHYGLCDGSLVYLFFSNLGEKDDNPGSSVGSSVDSSVDSSP